jgi:hypothetical protein
MSQLLETTLRAYVQADQRDWAAWLDVLQLAYNNAEHSSHKTTPAQLLLGYKPRMPLDFLMNSSQTVTEGHAGLQTGVKELEAHWEPAHDAIQRSTDWQAYQYDKGRRAPTLKVGDKVLINPHTLELVDVKGHSRKLVQHKIGPFEITEVINPTAYRLRLPETYPMHNVVNIQHLAKYHRGHNDSRPTLANPRDELRSSEEYKVEVDEQKRHGKSFYRIRWKAFDVENDTWQTAWDLRNVPELLKDWRMSLWCQRPVSPSQVMQVNLCAYHFIDRLISALSSCPLNTTMAINPHVLATHHVSYSFLLSSPATTQEGAISGYFADALTRSFLGLDKYNYLLHSGTYGPEEPGAAPTKFSLLTGGNYDRLFLPFVPGIAISLGLSPFMNGTSNGLWGMMQ